MSTPSQEPYTLAMIICDAIHRDPATRKCYLLGTFSSIAATKFPTQHPQMAVYVALTDGRGKTLLTIRLVSVDEDHILGEVKMEVEFADPRIVLDFTLTIANVTFPEPGEYRLQLFAGTTLLLERRLVVLQAGGEESE